MDGFALCRAWMQDAALKAIPFIFYSATYVRPEDEQFGSGAGRGALSDQAAGGGGVSAGTARGAAAVGRAAPRPPRPRRWTRPRPMLCTSRRSRARSRTRSRNWRRRTASCSESEARFRSLTEMSSDFYWESDAEHRLTLRTSAGKKPSTVPVFERGTQIGERRWEIPYLSPDAAGWPAHRAVLDAHQPFRDFETLAPGHRRQRALYLDQRRSGVRCLRRVQGLPRRRHRHHRAQGGRSKNPAADPALRRH